MLGESSIRYIRDGSDQEDIWGYFYELYWDHSIRTTTIFSPSFVNQNSYQEQFGGPLQELLILSKRYDPTMLAGLKGPSQVDLLYVQRGGGALLKRKVMIK